MLEAGSVGAGHHLTIHKGLAMLEKHAGRIPEACVLPVFQVRASVRPFLCLPLRLFFCPSVGKTGLTAVRHLCACRPPSRTWNTPRMGSDGRVAPCRVRVAWRFVSKGGAVPCRRVSLPLSLQYRPALTHSLTRSPAHSLAPPPPPGA